MMHHLNRTATTISQGLDRAACKLHEKKSNFLAAHRNTFASLYNDYDKKGQNGCLAQLQPLWKNMATDTENEQKEKETNRILASKLYGSKRPIINQHWEEIKNANGGSVLMCPICGIRGCEDMDHYVPQNVMPEYSVHLTNLIPLCHRCNHKKLDKWLDENGQRIVFNAYFDAVPTRLPISSQIISSSIDGTPEIKLLHKIATAADAPVYHLIDRTIDKLELMEVYRQDTEFAFRKELMRIQVRISRKTTASDKKAEWDVIKEEYRDLLQQNVFQTPVDLWMYTPIVNSIVMDSWVDGL